MKKVYSLLLFCLVVINVNAQTFDWAKREGLWAYDYGYGITTDNAGNVYVAGKYEEVNANFSGTLIPCEGNHDIFLAQYSQGGNLNWIRTAGGISGDYALAITCDGDSNIYIAGEIESPAGGDTIWFKGSSTTLVCKGANDIFLAKYDLNGNLLWAKSAGGYNYEKALGITHDQFGNLYVCGLFRGAATFGGTTIINSSGDNDIFLAKYDVNGNFKWVRKAGSSDRDEAKSVMCDAAGNIYICGMYSDNCVFGSQTLSSPNGFLDAFIAKYAPDGTLKWVETAGGLYDDVAWGLTIDNAGKIYITGEFNASLSFGSIPLYTTGNSDVFVACYDSSGTAHWAKNAGGNLIDRARGIGCDGTNLFITGQFAMSASFGSHTVSGVDSSEIFMAKLDNVGNFLWALDVDGVPDSVETLGYESGITICATPSGNVYASGALLDGGTFGSTSYGEFGRTDVFVTKISQGPDIVAPATVTFYPSDNSINIPTNHNLVITFDEIVQKGTGNIIIKEGGVTTQTIPVSSINVMVSANVVTIDPADFTNSAAVSIAISPGAFKDMANNNYAGITDSTTWNFTTQAPNFVTDINPNERIGIYPNPANENLIIDLSSVSMQKNEIKIYNSLSQNVKQISSQFESILNVDLSNLTSGIYFIEIQNGNGKFRDKIIVQH